MNWQLFAVIIYFLAMLAIGFVFFFKSKESSEKDYFLGGRSMGPWVTAMSAQASDMSGWLLMGFPGSIFAFGMGKVWIGIGLALGTAANWIFVARRLRRFSAAANDSITMPQYLTNRFASANPALKVICAIIFLISFTVYVASAFNAGTTVLSTVIPWFQTRQQLAMVIFAAIILLYTFMGGYKAVCWTDFFQGILMLIAVLAVPIVMTQVGSFNPVYNGAFADGVTAFSTNPFTVPWQDIEDLKQPLTQIGFFDFEELHFEVYEGKGGHMQGGIVLIDYTNHIALTGDIYINVRGLTPEQAEHNQYAPILMTSVDTDPALCAEERKAILQRLGVGEWQIFGGHGFKKEYSVK